VAAAAAGRSSKRSRRSRRHTPSPPPAGYQDENSIASCSTLNTAFVDVEDPAAAAAKWRPDVSAILPADVVRRKPEEVVAEPEIVAAVVRQVSLLERKFADDLGDVVCRVSRPLIRRRDIVTSRQHTVLFQNIEKVCSIGVTVIKELSGVKYHSLYMPLLNDNEVTFMLNFMCTS